MAVWRDLSKVAEILSQGVDWLSSVCRQCVHSHSFVAMPDDIAVYFDGHHCQSARLPWWPSHSGTASRHASLHTRQPSRPNSLDRNCRGWSTAVYVVSVGSDTLIGWRYEEAIRRIPAQLSGVSRFILRWAARALDYICAGTSATTRTGGHTSPRITTSDGQVPPWIITSTSL